jgi:hypothetical protein
MNCLERQEWENVSPDPRLEDDLGYDLLELDILPSDGSDNHMVLPHDEDLIEEEMFLVVEDSGVCELLNWL